MIAGGFFVLQRVGVLPAAKNRHTEFAKRSIAIAMPFSLLFCLLALGTGDWQGKNVAKHQPAKLAAMEGQYKTRPTPRCTCSAFPMTRRMRSSTAWRCRAC
jgi:cytochrome d ubiquinol oxidase subunit I